MAECIASRTPMRVLPRDSPEDALVVRTLASAGVARVASPGEPIDLPAADDLSRMRRAYARADPSWSTCDPIFVARKILEV